MNNLAVKEVNFNGNMLMAAQDQTTEKVYVGVSWVCNGIGLTEKQKDRQVANIQSDIVLSQGVNKLPLKYEGQFRNVLCIELDFLPLWLAKISITPKMKSGSPEVVENLISYQLKAKEVLANAFVHNVKQIIPATYKEALLALVESIEEKERLEQENLQLETTVKENAPKVSYHDRILQSKGTLTTTQIAKDYGITSQKLNKILHAEGVQFKQSNQWLLYSKHQDQGYTKSHTFIDNFGESRLNTKWTQKGRLFIHNILESQNIKAKIDK